MHELSLLTHPQAIAWRNRLRSNSLLRGIYKFWMARHAYEERFGRELLAAIAPGDVVWDIGANVGLYTERFLAHQASSVVCFEPAPDAVRILRQRFEPDSRVQIVPVALSVARGTARFTANGCAPTNRIAAATEAGPSIDVPVLRADQAAAEYRLPSPNIVKIDVEGYELEVIQGMGSLLASTALRSLFVEVHFALLHARGLDDAPSRIVTALSDGGFRATWPDPSHLCGTRVPPRRQSA